MPRLVIVATILADVARRAWLQRGKGGRADRRDPSVSGYTRTKRLAGWSFTAARAERRARARSCAHRAGPPGDEGEGGVRRARGRGLNGPKGRDRGAAGLLWLFLFSSEFLIHFPFIFSSELNSNSNPI
jgi:hypothetical protein